MATSRGMQAAVRDAHADEPTGEPRDDEFSDAFGSNRESGDEASREIGAAAVDRGGVADVAEDVDGDRGRRSRDRRAET